MGSVIRDIGTELSDNWPAFLYIAMTVGFSVCFLRERRAETRVLKQIGEGLHESVKARFDRLEGMIEKMAAKELRGTDPLRDRDQAGGTTRST
jgi:hypothetical protein